MSNMSHYHQKGFYIIAKMRCEGKGIRGNLPIFSEMIKITSAKPIVSQTNFLRHTKFI